MNNLNLAEKIKALIRLIIPVQGNLFLTFEPIGQTIDEEDFKGPDGAFSPAIAREITSELANFIPRTSEIIELNQGQVDLTYEILVTSSQFAVPAGNQEINSDELAFFGNLKAKAKIDDSEKIAGFSTAEERYPPVEASPADWSDPAKTANWKTHSFEVKTTVPASDSSAPQNGGGKSPQQDSLLNGWKLSMNPAAVQGAINNQKVVLRKDVFQVKPSVSPLAVQSSTLAVLLQKNPSLLMPVATSTVTKPGTSAISTVLNTKISQTAFTTMKRGVDSIDAPTARGGETITPLLSAVKLVYLPDRFKLLRSLFEEKAKPATQPVETKSYTVEFKYCLVRLKRNWFVSDFLRYPNWYAFGRKAGGISTGSLSNNNGQMPAVPIAFLAVKDLAITGDWAPGDQAVVEQALGLGPFNLDSKVFQQKKISIPGIQVISWVCEVLPLTPSKDDPALSVA